jgi:putative N6-adenine-specific DNA methylase
MYRPHPGDAELRLLATAARGTESVVAAELADLGVDNPRVVPGGVRFVGPLTLAMKLCLWSRTANRILVLIGQDRVQADNQLYPAVRAMNWLDWVTPTTTVAVHAHTRGEVLRNSHFVTLKIKDAVVDAVRDRHGSRPNVERINPAIEVVAFGRNGELDVLIALQGPPLNQRGYRAAEVDAPLKETLAAALLRDAGWARPRPLHDVTCGSGTIAIEAAWMAMDRAPGLGRRFAFERWNHVFPGELASAWRGLTDEAKERIRDSIGGVIIASDIDRQAVRATRTNLAAAGVKGVIVREADARSLERLPGAGAFVFNPPYGERIGEDIVTLHDEIGTALARCSGNSASLITVPEGVEGLTDGLGLEPERADIVFNGPLRCMFAHYGVPGEE